MTDLTAPKSPSVARAGAGRARNYNTDLAARGEPMVWAMGGSLAIGLLMIVGILGLIAWMGFTTFWPQPVSVVTTKDGKVIAGEVFRSETYKPSEDQFKAMSPEEQAAVTAEDGYAHRTLYRVGNYDLYGEDFQWRNDFEVTSTEYPADFTYIERQEWGVFIGRVSSMSLNGVVTDAPGIDALNDAVNAGQDRRAEIIALKTDEIGENSHEIEALRLEVKAAALDYGANDQRTKDIAADVAERTRALEAEFSRAEYAACRPAGGGREIRPDADRHYRPDQTAAFVVHRPPLQAERSQLPAETGRLFRPLGRVHLLAAA
ncbi:MAG: hypothetical protein QM698_04190 [Micropepsaceae bacterium]